MYDLLIVTYYILYSMSGMNVKKIFMYIIYIFPQLFETARK